MGTKREILRYQLCVKGIFGRNRKVKFEIFTLVKECDPSKPMTLDALMPLYRAKLAEIKFKGGVARITEDPLTVEENVIGTKVFTSESFMIFSEKVIYEEKIEGGEVVFR